MFGITENSFTFALTKQKDKMVSKNTGRKNHVYRQEFKKWV